MIKQQQQQQRAYLDPKHYGMARKMPFKAPHKAGLTYDTQDRLAALQKAVGGSFDVLVAKAVESFYVATFSDGQEGHATEEITPE